MLPDVIPNGLHSGLGAHLPRPVCHTTLGYFYLSEVWGYLKICVLCWKFCFYCHDGFSSVMCVQDCLVFEDLGSLICWLFNLNLEDSVLEGGGKDKTAGALL